MKSAVEKRRAFVDLVKRAASEMEQFRLEVHGDCVHGIEQNEAVESVPPRPEVGDLVLYFREEPWELYVHRVVEWDGSTGTMTAKGDTASFRDPEMPVENVLSKVSAMDEQPTAPSVEVDVTTRLVVPDALFYARTDDGGVAFQAATGSMLTVSPRGLELVEALDGASVAALDTPVDDDRLLEFARNAASRGLLEPTGNG